MLASIKTAVAVCRRSSVDGGFGDESGTRFCGVVWSRKLFWIAVF